MNKILIKAPSTKEEVLSSYMLIHHLYCDLPDAEIYIIVDRKLERYYHYIPFDVRLHVVDDSTMGLSAIHKFAYNLHEIFNVDYFFDLQETKESAFYGVAFKAKNRFGYGEGFIRNLFLNNIIEKNETESTDYQYLKLLTSSGLLASEMSTFSGNEAEVNIEESFKHIILLFEEFSFQEGQIIKLFKDNFPESELTVYSENKDIEFKGLVPVHDVDELLALLQKDCLCISNTSYNYGLLKYMKQRFINFGSFKDQYPFFEGRSLDLLINDCGKIENLSINSEELLETDCIKELSKSFLEINS